MKANVLLVDCRDSFTANLEHALCRAGARVVVRRGSEAVRAAESIAEFTHLVISPGPGAPESAPEAEDALRRAERFVPVLGVCLGHQVIARRFGANVGPALRPQHGKTAHVTHDGCLLFREVPQPMRVARYHSLVVDPPPADAPLVVVARAEEDGAIMAVRHRTEPIFGVQFHPESFLTEGGSVLLRNFLQIGSKS